VTQAQKFDTQLAQVMREDFQAKTLEVPAFGGIKRLQ